MNNLDELRVQIDTIDEQLKELFLKRLAVASAIGAYKKSNNLPILNQKREDEMINKHRLTFSDEKLWELYQSFLKTVIALSKEVQK